MEQAQTKRSDHAATYNNGVAGWVHRDRLKHLMSIVGDLDLQDEGQLADFGCSDGFVLSRLRERDAFANWNFTGFDNKQPHLEAARLRALDAEFELADLNLPTPELRHRFDLVLCLETLEHVGNFRAALSNVIGAARPGGVVIISVPNETGLPGTIKYAGRRLTRRNPYGDFFKTQSERRYVTDLILGRQLDTYRQPERWGWGPHLGFDIDVFEGHLRDAHIGKRCELVRRTKTGRVGFNVFYVLRVM